MEDERGWKMKGDGKRKGMEDERGWKMKGGGRRKGMEDERGWKKKEERGGEVVEFCLY